MSVLCSFMCTVGYCVSSELYFKSSVSKKRPAATLITVRVLLEGRHHWFSPWHFTLVEPHVFRSMETTFLCGLTFAPKQLSFFTHSLTGVVRSTTLLTKHDTKSLPCKETKVTAVLKTHELFEVSKFRWHLIINITQIYVQKWLKINELKHKDPKCRRVAPIQHQFIGTVAKSFIQMY